MSDIRFYFSGNFDSYGKVGVLDATDNVEEFYPRDYLKNSGIPIIGINEELELGYKFSDECFSYELVEIHNIRGWQLKHKEGVSKFRCKSMEFGYPIISLEYCFEKYNSKSIDVSNMDTSNVIVMSLMFYHCDSLNVLDLSNFDTSNVTNMRSMFLDCYNLALLDVSNFDTSKVTIMIAMFSGCENLISLDLSNFNTSKVTNMRNMFYKCKKLTSLDLSNFDTSKVTSMKYMFDKCEKLTSLDVSNFDTSNVMDMSYMFSNCNLTLLDLSNFDTGRVKDMDEMFTYSKFEFLICKSKLIFNKVRRQNSFVTILVPETVQGITFDKRIKIPKNIDLKALYAKLKFTGLTGKTIGYKEV